ncbi:beta-lactamase family protein [Amniculicola lignicola CBS 123094]|uniref:Beta-lactamase family protein n=1 Tax=Amniculicola lignicola CBS 123094 TaxID=1392246 RepID=A0A6A5WUK1_9PLEO|nr:beta-lactamase family protein [Amniculicola lignicola CBS 123094]
MVDIEKIIDKAIADQDIPGCVLTATNRDGSFTYSRAFGTRSLHPDHDQSPLKTNTVMWIASCTKLMTAICALQLVEQGKLTLDDPIYNIVPELKDHPILEGFSKDGNPILKPHKNPITLKLLLTHSSGLTYAAMHPLTIQLLAYQGKEPPMDSKLLDRFSCPLVYEPGTQWAYSSGIDYAGLMVERVSGLTLEEYMRKNLWEPLGIKDMTFFLSKRPDMQARLADMSKRDPETGKAVKTDGRQPYMTADRGEVEDCMGGQGVFATPEEYMKILHGVLTTDENEKILKKDSVEKLFSPYLGDQSTVLLNKYLEVKMINDAMGGTPTSVKKSYALGGLLVLGDVNGDKNFRGGSMFWGGLPNLSWFVDRKTGLCGLYAGQVIPPGDAKCSELNSRFQEAMYERYHKQRGVSPNL